MIVVAVFAGSRGNWLQRLFFFLDLWVIGGEALRLIEGR